MADYLLLDAAQIDNFMVQLYQLGSAPEFDWLFANTPYSELKDLGPILLRAEQDSKLRQHFEEYWSLTAGWVFSSSEPMETLVDHFRSVIHVNCAEATLLFRYYDPRILRIWLAHVLPAEIDDFMGPATSLKIRASNGDWLEYHNHAQPAMAQRYQTQPWLHLSQQQLLMLNTAKQDRFNEKLLAHLEQCFPEQLQPLSLEQKQDLVSYCRKTAAQYQFINAQQIVRWSNLVVSVGGQFPEGQQHHAYRQVLESDTLDPDQQLENMLNLTYHHMFIQDENHS